MKFPENHVNVLFYRYNVVTNNYLKKNTRSTAFDSHTNTLVNKNQDAMHISFDLCQAVNMYD